MQTDSPNSDPTDLPPETISRYLEGTLDLATMQQVKAVLEATDRQRAYLAGLRAALRVENAEAMPPLDQTWEELLAQARALEPAKHTSTQRAAHDRSRGPWVQGFQGGVRRTAIAVAGVAGIVGIAMLFRVGMAPSTSETSPKHYTTHAGQRATVTLASGFTAMLAPSTSVTVLKDRVTVAGEAYFTVAPEASRAIVVQTHNAMIRVLGARFLVRQYQNESVSRVVVEDGRVALHALQGEHPSPASRTQTILSAHMLAHVSDSGVTVTPDIRTDTYTGWTRGTLVFDRTPLRDVVKDLARAYGVDIQIADSLLASKRMTAELDVSEKPLTRVLLILGETMDAHYVVSGGTYLLSPGRRDSEVPREGIPQNRFPQPERQYGR